MMTIQWTLPEGVSKKQLLRKAEELPASPAGLDEAGMQEGLLMLLQLMLYAYYDGDKGQVQSREKQVYDWLQEASARGYSGYVWDYLNMELLKTDARLYAGIDQWEKAGEDLEQCAPYLARIEQTLGNGSIDIQDRLCLTAACAELEMLRYYQKKHTVSGREPYRVLGESDRFFGWMPAGMKDTEMSAELRVFLGLQQVFSATKLIALGEKDRAEACFRRGNDIIQCDRLPYGELTFDAVSHRIMCLYAEGLWRFNSSFESGDAWLEYFNGYRERLVDCKQQVEWGLPDSDITGLASAVLNGCWALMMSNGIVSATSDPEANPAELLKNSALFADLLPDVLKELKTSVMRRHRGWDLLLDLMAEQIYMMRLSMLVIQEKIVELQGNYAEARKKNETVLKELNRQDMPTDLIQQLVLQLTCQYNTVMIELESGGEDKAYYLSRQTLDMVRQTGFGMELPGAEIILSTLCALAGMGALSVKEKDAARGYAEDGLAVIERLELKDDPAAFSQDLQSIKKELKKVLRKSKGFFF